MSDFIISEFYAEMKNIKFRSIWNFRFIRQNTYAWHRF